jgi:FKBP-type peptidyl-prolyl cis-trans isomerase FklB
MKAVAAVSVCVLLFSANLQAQKKPIFKNYQDSLSYVIGINIGTDMKNRSISINPDLLLRGLKEGLNDKKGILPEEEVQRIMMSFQKDMMAKQRESMSKVADKNKKEGNAFLAQNKKRDSVVTTQSGLQYKILVQGTGKSPQPTDTVDVHYRGMLIDGTEFDNSYKRGGPATFPTNGVIKGWIEALQLMKEGSKWQLFIPSELAYGERGAGQTIGPNAVLIFDVELLKVH